MNESTAYFPPRIIMPKNLFSIEKLNNDAETWFVVDEDIADIDTSTFTVNYTRGTIFRADQRIMFNMTVRDKYNNVRNQSRYSSADTMIAEVYHDGGLESTNTFLP